MSLLALQRGFRDHLLAGADRPLPTVRPTAMRGLAVYRHAYRAQLAACLRDSYAKTWAWLGDGAFDAAARQYVETHPPSSWTLNDYGAGFAETLRALHPLDPEVRELAWLDWALRRAFDGPDGATVAADALAGIDWEIAVLGFVPTLAVSELTTNAAAIWSAIGEGRTPPPAERLPAVGAIRVWRSGLSPKFRSIGAFEHRALALAQASHGFARLCEELADEAGEEAASRLGSVLAAWIGDGLIASIRA